MLFKYDPITATRCLGALLLLPVVAAVWLGNISAGIVVTVLSVVMAYEFSKMLKLPFFFGIIMVIVIASQAMPIWLVDFGVWWHLGLSLVAMVITAIFQKYIVAFFALTLSFCFYSVALLLAEPDGHLLLIGLAAVIAACDSAAYFVGRFVGGPKLAPRISPNKTISGGFAGLFAAVAVTIVIAPLYDLGIVWAVQVGFGLGLLSQIGDFFESFIKRKVDVKDSGTILPGHGGLLDRFDGYLFAIPGFYLILFGM